MCASESDSLDDDKDSNITYEPMQVVQDAEDNSAHEFAVKKLGTTYYAPWQLLTRNRPAKATLKFRKVDEGGECVLSILLLKLQLSFCKSRFRLGIIIR